MKNWMCPSCECKEKPQTSSYFPLELVEYVNCHGKRFIRQFDKDNDDYQRIPLSAFL